MKERHGVEQLRVCLIVLPVALVGCGGGVGEVRGKVTYQDKPVCSGNVVIVGADSLPYYGPIQEDGSYTAKGVIAGEAKVAVFSPGPTPPPGGSVSPRLKKQNENPIDLNKWFPLPDRYADHATSGLTLTVHRGENKYDIPLK
jgi:hypothetical protein